MSDFRVPFKVILLNYCKCSVARRFHSSTHTHVSITNRSITPPTSMLDIINHSSTFPASTRVYPRKPSHQSPSVRDTHSVKWTFCHWSSPSLSFCRGKLNLREVKSLTKVCSKWQSWDLNSGLTPDYSLPMSHCRLTAPLLASYSLHSMTFQFQHLCSCVWVNV